MSYRELRSQVKQCVESALKANGFPPIEFEPVEPPRPEFGDLSVAVALNLAGRLKMKPLDVAERIVSKISIPEGSLIQRCWVHPPGYVNFSIIYPQYAKQTILNTLSDGANYGRINIGGGARTGIEHTSVNPNKALHYGHLRNVVLGDTIRRILSFTGYEAQILNYIDDSGLQVADLIVGFRYAGFNSEPENEEKFDHYCGDTVYVKVNDLYETRKDLLDRQKQVLREMEDHSSDTARLASKITLRILREQLKTCWRIGAR
jgi:arginyl-tRNA synthetase